MQQDTKRIYAAFLWHGFFLALTMSMLDLNTVFPSLLDQLTPSKLIFGILYSIMLGVPLIFNVVFSHYLRWHALKKKFLLAGIYLRASSFLGMALSMHFLAVRAPALTTASFFLWIFLFSISAGFASISYADIIGKALTPIQRNRLYAGKQMLASVAGLVGSLVIQRIFSGADLAYPSTYSLTLTIGFVGLFLAGLGFPFIKEPPSPPPQDGHSRLRDFVRDIPILLRKDRQFRKFLVVENMASFGVMVLPFYMVFAREQLGADSTFLGYYLFLQVSGSIASNLLWGFLGQRWGARLVVRTCIVMGGMLPILALATASLGARWFGLVFLVTGFLVSGRRVGFEPYLLDIAPAQQRTEYLGIRGTFNVLVVILPILGGVFIDLMGYPAAFLITAVVMLSAALLMGSDRVKPS